MQYRIIRSPDCCGCAAFPYAVCGACYQYNRDRQNKLMDDQLEYQYIDQSLYSTEILKEGATEVRLFQKPSVSTRDETNMYHIGHLPEGQQFECRSIKCHLPTGSADLLTRSQVIENAWIDVRISDRTLLEYPLSLMDNYHQYLVKPVIMPITIQWSQVFCVHVFVKQPCKRDCQMTIELCGILRRPN